MIKLIATDVDYTLLDKDSKLSEYNKKAIKDCIKSGIAVVLATDKTMDFIIGLAEELGLKLPQITLNGYVIVDRKFKIIKSIKIGPENFYRIIRTIKEKGYSPLIALEDGRILYEKYTSNMEALMQVGEKLLRIDSFEKQNLAEKTVNINVPIEKKDPLDKFLRDKFSDDLQLIRSGRLFLIY